MQHDENEETDHYPISYSIDNQMIMHRDAHFGGNFTYMLDHYKNEGKGVNKEFEVSRIEELQQLEQQSGRNLATFMLSGAEAENISKARQAYKSLREVYMVKEPKSQIPKLIADLILAENDEADAAILAVIAEKSAIVPALVDLLRNEDFFDPLFPGYGYAPTLAAHCLGKIGDKRAIISLFEALGEGDFFNDDILLDALYSIGEPARTFLLHVLNARPINLDNEQAAIALIKFKEDPTVSEACLALLKEINLKQQEALATYLVLACESLSHDNQSELLKIANLPTTPSTIKRDIQTLLNS